MIRMLALILLVLASSFAAEGVPLPPLDQVAFQPARDAALPLDAAFADEAGHTVHLAAYVGTRPLIIAPVYFGCSNLCQTVLQGLAHGLRNAGIRPGRDVEVIAVSISPWEKPADALRDKRDVLGDAATPGWHFLTGGEAGIDLVAAALGYRYAYDTAEGQYAHASGIVFASADGAIRQALYGATFTPGALAQGLAAARAAADADAPAQSSAPAHWLLCFRYDPHTGRYSFVALNAVRTAALLALISLGGYVVAARLRERRQDRSTRP